MVQSLLISKKTVGIRFKKEDFKSASKTFNNVFTIILAFNVKLLSNIVAAEAIFVEKHLLKRGIFKNKIVEYPKISKAAPGGTAL